MGPSGVRIARRSWFDIRDNGLAKTMEGARSVLLKEGSLRKDYRVRVHTHDYPTPGGGGAIEFQTISEMGGNDRLFPDWVFGGWWHMGMENWDPFVRDLAAAGELPPTDRRAYWKGAHLGVHQRAAYSHLCTSNPDRFAGGFMNWGPNGTHNNFTPMRDQCRHAVLVDLTGVGFSGRLKMLAFTGRPLIVADRRWWSWADQVVLSRGLHFRVREDLSDIVEVYDRVMGDTKEATRMASELRRFCLEGLTFEKACLRAAELLREQIGKREKIL